MNGILRKVKSYIKNHTPEKEIDSKKKTQIKLRRKLQQRQTADFYYLIDIVGTCNLRCPSCPVGNYPDVLPKGLMSLDYYKAVLDKIEREHPNERVFIDLYNWGEPGLHKNLGEIIRITKEKGYGVGISTNLNNFPDMSSVIKQNPSYIRISLSGFYNETYQKTHRRGDINLVKSNMHLLRHKIDQYKSDTIIQVGFHIYKGNFKNDFPKMRELCDDLGFIFAPTLAALMPVEKAVKVVDGEELKDEKEVLDNLVVSTEKRVEMLSKFRDKYRDCQYRRVRTTINFDGSVPICCATFEESQIIAKDFLELSRKEIQSRKYKHPFCKTCQARSLDMVYTNVEPQFVEEYAITVLGPEYKKFQDEWNVSLEPVVEWENKELSAQDAYDLAYSFETTDAPKAIKIYTALVDAFPRHGEGLFRLGNLLAAKQDFEGALKMYGSALSLVPTHQPYLDAFARIKEKRELA